MTKRWKDRIQILAQSAGTYDAWGHSVGEAWTETNEIWADVIPIMGTTATAKVTVQMPFDYDKTVHIWWQNYNWKIIQAPIQLPNSQFIQFKIERL